MVLSDGHAEVAAGLYTFTITKIDFNNGQDCSIDGLSISDPFEIQADPDVSNINLSVNDICIGTDAVLRFFLKLEIV